MEIHPVDIVISLINIVVLFVLLRVILWKYVVNYLNDRRNSIQAQIDDAEMQRREAEELLRGYNQKIEDIEERGQEIIQESRQRAKEEYEQILSDARTAAAKLTSDAEFHIEISKNQALKDAHADIAQLATQMATRILEREISSVDNEHAVEEFFKDL